MKNSILIALVLIGFLQNAKSQDRKAYTNPYLDKFVGVWVSKQNDKTISVTLQKTTNTVKNVTIDVIEGYYTIKLGQKVIEAATGKPTLKLGTTFSESGENTPNKIYLTLFDQTKRKGGKVILTFQPDNPNEIMWSLLNGEGTRVHKQGENKFDRTFTLPTNLTLTRQ